MEALNIEEIFKNFAGYVALGMEIIAVVIIAIGADKAVIGLITRQAYTATHLYT